MGRSVDRSLVSRTKKLACPCESRRKCDSWGCVYVSPIENFERSKEEKTVSEEMGSWSQILSDRRQRLIRQTEGA
jgi:hypothetical protein